MVKFKCDISSSYVPLAHTDQPFVQSKNIQNIVHEHKARVSSVDVLYKYLDGFSLGRLVQDSSGHFNNTLCSFNVCYQVIKLWRHGYGAARVNEPINNAGEIEERAIVRVSNQCVVGLGKEDGFWYV